MRTVMLAAMCLVVLSACSRHEEVAESKAKSVQTDAPSFVQEQQSDAHTPSGHIDHTSDGVIPHEHGQPNTRGHDVGRHHAQHSGHGGNAEHHLTTPAHNKGHQHAGESAPGKHNHDPAAQAGHQHERQGDGHGHQSPQRDNQAVASNAFVPDDDERLNDTAENLSAAEIFDRRILPIARSGKGSSCTECHFGGVELRNYVREDQATTFGALRDEGLIDVEKPDQSKLLQFIGRQSEKTDPLLAKVRQAEYRAFRTWIRAAVLDPKLLTAKATDVNVGSELPVEVIRHMRRDRVVQSFVENVWSEIGRCINCHSPERNEKLVQKHGMQVSWIRPRDPAGTLAQCVEQGIIDPDAPEESLILQKPLVLVEHGGGPKFALGSRTDKNFRRFLKDYAAVVNAKYQRKDQLPEPPVQVAVLTGQHLRIDDLPQQFDKKLLRVELFRWTDDGWSDMPWGTAENPINGAKKVWQSMVFAVAPRGSERAQAFQGVEKVQLPAGRYRIKIYIDQEDKTKQDRDYELRAAELYGHVEIDGEWPPGYQPPKVVRAPDR